MKRLVLLSLLSFCFITVFSFPVDTAKVNRTFALMVKSGYTAETQREFFNAFPVPGMNSGLHTETYLRLIILNQVTGNIYTKACIN